MGRVPMGEHDEGCSLRYKNPRLREGVSPASCEYCSAAAAIRERIVAGIQAAWDEHAFDHCDTQACTWCRNFEVSICRVRDVPFSPVGIFDMLGISPNA